MHGTEVVVQAAALLRQQKNIHFVIGGDGLLRPAIQKMIADWGLTNVDLVGWIPLEQLPDYIASASICLGGHFSTVPKARRVISTKTFQFIAMRKPTIVGDNSATREIFVHGEHVYAVPMGDPVALATAIVELADNKNLQNRIAIGGYTCFQKRLTLHTIGMQIASLVEEVMGVSAL